MAIHLLPPFLFLLSGIARAGFADREYQATNSNLYHWMSWIGLNQWYLGGTNLGYNQSTPWSADFKHFCFYIWNWGLVFGSCVGVSLNDTFLGWLLIVLQVVVFHEWMFIYFFHYVFPERPDGNFKHFVRRVLTPWK